jgi:hypothetical protein
MIYDDENVCVQLQTEIQLMAIIWMIDVVLTCFYMFHMFDASHLFTSSEEVQKLLM